MCLTSEMAGFSRLQGHGIRPDGRKSSDSRPVIVNTGQLWIHYKI